MGLAWLTMMSQCAPKTMRLNPDREMDQFEICMAEEMMRSQNNHLHPRFWAM